MVRLTIFAGAKQAFEKVVMRQRVNLASRVNERQPKEPETIELKEKQKPVIRKKIFDSLVLNLKGGSGGCGNPKLRGKGGRGGDVYLIATKGETLKELTKKLPHSQIHAESGSDATNKNKCLGKDGTDKWVPVPVGVNIYDNLGNYLGALSKEGHAMLLAKGGSGGNAKNNYKLHGGVAVSAKIELQVVADVGVVGLQGSGKSTLVRHLIGHVNSPPTEKTLYADVSNMSYPDLRRISIMDTPCMWRGISTAENRHGKQLLNLLSRTRLLLLCLDASKSLATPTENVSLFDSFLLLNKELETYQPKILSKPVIVVVNRFNSSESQFDHFEEHIKNLNDIMPSIPAKLRPNALFKVKHVVGIDLGTKQAETLADIRQKIRLYLDLHEQERVEKEIEHSRMLKRSARSSQ